MATILDQINAINSDSVTLATDQAAVVTAQNALAAAQAQVVTDDTTVTAADAALSASLQANGPVFIVNGDGTGSFFAFSTLPPGFTITVAKPAGGVTTP